MRAVSVHEDAVVVTSLYWQTTATAIRAGEEVMLIDSPYFPDELELLPTVLAQSGFEPAALLATHGDFDHLLGRMAFPELSLGVAESTMLRFREKPGEAQRDLRDYDSEAYVERPRPLALGQTQSLPVPGKLGLGRASWSCTRPRATPRTGWRCSRRGWAPVRRRLPQRRGDPWLSDPARSRLPLDPRAARVARRARRRDRARTRYPASRERALELLEEDLRYLDALREAAGSAPPGATPRDSARSTRELARAATASRP